MEDVRFFHQQAKRCYQLAWQFFDLRVAQKLNLLAMSIQQRRARFVCGKQRGR